MEPGKNKSVQHKPFRIQEAVSETGPEVEQRKRVIEVYATADQPGAFQNLDQNKRRHGRAEKVKDSMVIILCEQDEEILPLGKQHNLIYYIDDTEGAKAERPRIRDYYWVPATVSSLKVLDDAEHRESGFMLYSKADELGRRQLICYKLSETQRSKITTKKWEGHYIVLKEAFETQPDNPRGTRKIGQFLRYIMYGWHQQRLTRLIAEYVTKPLTEKEKEDEEKKTAHEAKVGQVRVGMKKFMKEMENVGLIAVAEKDISIQNKLKQKLNLFRIMRSCWKGRFSQVAIAIGNWSPLHTDDDFFYTLLSCYCPTVATRAGREEILFYFLFPSVGMAVPMRNTDILVFNSAFPHCASNPRRDETITVSMFTGAKTAVAQMCHGNADLIPEPESDGEDNDEERKQDSNRSLNPPTARRTMRRSTKTKTK